MEFRYKGRIHKNKLSVRSLRYALTDQLARGIPALKRRWLFPTEGLEVARAAKSDLALPSVRIDEALPEVLQILRVGHTPPLQLVHHVYGLEEICVTGWAGAMMQDGHLLTVRPKHNWVSGLRAEPYRLRKLRADVSFFNMMAPIPATGHIFHWLYDAVIPLLSFLERTASREPLGLLVNESQSEIQARTLDYICERYAIAAVERLGKRDAVLAPKLFASIPVPYDPRGLQAPEGLAKIDDLSVFLTKAEPDDSLSRRIYISRADARLRRVLNEEELLPMLRAHGFELVVLKGMPVGRQVQLFRDAEAVVAPHGAGLAHLTWARPSTKVVEFFPDPSGPRGRVKNASADYWLIAKTRGLDYACYFGGPSLDRADGFRIELAMLEAALRVV